jgi:multidrug efflux system membrane fusion protein
VQARLAETGQYAQPGTPIATVVDRSRLLLRFSVPAGDAAPLARDLAVAFQVPGDPAAHAAGIILVADAADPATRLVPVVALVAPAEAAGLRPGAFASVTVDLPPGAPQLLVPDLAVKPSQRGFLAYVVEDGKDGPVARERVVQIAGRTRDDRVVVSAGLTAGERVVRRGAEALRDGAPLTIAAAEAVQP